MSHPTYAMFTPAGDADVDKAVQRCIALLDKSPQEAFLYLRSALVHLETIHPEVMDTEVRDFIMTTLEPELQSRRIGHDWEFVYWGVLAGVLQPMDKERVWDSVQEIIEKSKKRLDEL